MLHRAPEAAAPLAPPPRPRAAAPGDAPATPPRRPASPSALGEVMSPVSPGSAQRTPWSARETELLLDTLLEPGVWRALLLDRRQQVRRTPAQCRRRYKFLKDKFREAHGQPSGPFDDQIRQLMGLLGDNGRKRPRPRGRARPQRAPRSLPRAGAPPDPHPTAPSAFPAPARRDPDADTTWRLRFSPSPAIPRPDGPRHLPPGGPRARPLPSTPPPPAPDPTREDPDSPPATRGPRAPPAALPYVERRPAADLGAHWATCVSIPGPAARPAADPEPALRAAERWVFRDPCQ
uniref:Undifferentiated embryonic cell transcription factor 1 n=1 Tax=Aotus nancymaae TaxID=37293 RepID=A0A2K5CJQ5_AOTNA